MGGGEGFKKRVGGGRGTNISSILKWDTQISPILRPPLSEEGAQILQRKIWKPPPPSPQMICVWFFNIEHYRACIV